MRHFPGPGGGMGSSMLWGFFGFIGTLVVLGLIALFVVYLVKKSKGKQFGPGPMGHHPHHRPPMPPALQILDERLARGEIEVEDYMTRRAALLGGGGPTNEWTPQAPTPPRPEAPAADGGEPTA